MRIIVHILLLLSLLCSGFLGVKALTTAAGDWDILGPWLWFGLSLGGELLAVIWSAAKGRLLHPGEKPPRRNPFSR